MIYLGKSIVGIASLIERSMDNWFVYIADYKADPPTIAEGVLDTLNRRIYVV